MKYIKNRKLQQKARENNEIVPYLRSKSGDRQYLSHQKCSDGNRQQAVKLGNKHAKSIWFNTNNNSEYSVSFLLYVSQMI